MFKKSLSVLLSIVLILTSIISVVMADGNDVVLSVDFESYPSGGALNKFKVVDTGDTTHGKALYGNFSAADANTSPAAAIFTSGTAAKLEKGTEYEITISYKAVNLNSTFALNLLYSDNANSYVRKKIPGTSTNTSALTNPYLVRFVHNGTDATVRNQWLSTTVTFTPEYDAYAYLGFWTDVITEIYIDDVVITKKVATPPPAPVDPNKIVDLDFESYPSGGALNKFKIADTGDAAQGKALYGDFSAADANASPAAAIMTSATPKLEKGSTYEVSLKYKAININTSFAFNLYYTDNANSYVRKKVPNTTTNTSVAVSPNLVRFSHTDPGKTVLNQWIEVTASFTAEYDAYVYLGLWTDKITEFYIDDFNITKVVSVKVNFNTNGGNTVDPLSGVAGAALPSLPVPEKEGVSFGGWYSDEELITPFTATTFPESDITLYAKWKQEGLYEQNFESYNTSVSGILSKYILYTSSGTDGNAHSGTKSLYRNANNDTFRVAVFPDETKAPLVAGNTYELRFWVKIASAITATGTIQLMYSPDKNNCNAQATGSATPNICVLKKAGETSTNIDASKVGEWQEVVYNFSATHNGFLNLSGWGSNEYYLDDISLKCTDVANATISFNSNGGSAVNPIKGVAGAALQALPVPVKTEKAFDGWYTDEALTARFTATTFPEGNITLYAKWVDEGTYFQDFEGYAISGNIATNTLSVYTKKSERDPFVHDGNKSLYKPADNSSYFVSPFPYATKKLEAGKGYKLNIWVYAPQKMDKASEGAWQLTLLDEKDNAFAVGDRKKINIKYFNSNFKEGEWQQLELIFTASADGFMGLYAYGAFEMYIDNISLIEVDTVTVTFDTCGGDPMESVSGPVGMIVSNIPTPTHPEEMAFAGWFTDKEYTKRFNFKEFPETDLKLYAKWIKKGSFEQTFEGYYYENDTAASTYSKDVLTVYHATSENDEYVHSGKASMRYYHKNIPESKTYGFSIFDPTMGQLEIGEKYYVSYWIKAKEITSTFYHAVYNNSVVNNMFANYNMKGYFTTHADVIGKKGNVSEYFFGPEGKYSVSEPDENGWVKFTFETIATDKYFSIYLNWDAEVYIDDVVIEPIPTGVVDEDYSKPCCEPLYDEIHSNYPAASLTKSEEVQIYKLDLNPRGDYVFSADIRPNNKGAYVALSFDGVNIIDGTKITFNSAKRIMLDKTGRVYLHVYNPIGESLFGRLALFNTRAAKIKAVDVFDSNLNADIPELSELLKQDKYLEILAEADFITDDSSFENTDSDEEQKQEEENQHDDSTSPQTGDNTPIALISILFFTLISIIFVSFKQRGRKYE